jgi:predicted ester cyclase
MSAEENKFLVYEAISKFNEGNLDGYLAHYDEGLVTHGYPPELPANLDGIKAFYAMIMSAFSNARVELHEVLAERDEVACRYTFRAKHTGDFMGIPPTNKDVVMGGITILRLRDRRFIERWQNADLMGLMTQLGAIPAPEGAEA